MKIQRINREPKYIVHLSAEESREGPGEEDGEDAHEEGADGGQEEAPPLPGLETLCVTDVIIEHLDLIIHHIVQDLARDG